MKKQSTLIAIGLMLYVIFISCKKEDIFLEPEKTFIVTNSSGNTKQYRADVANNWFKMELKLIKSDGKFTPPVASRAIGYTGFALYEAVVNHMNNYQSIASQVGAPKMPKADNKSINEALAANSAMYAVVKNIFVYSGSTNSNALAWCDSLYLANKAIESVDVPAGKIALSESYGAYVGNAVYAWSATDPVGHMAQMHNTDPFYAFPTVAGAWQSAALPVQPHWGSARSFLAANNMGSSLPAAPFPFSTTPGSDFYNQAMVVYNTTTHLTAEQTTIALYWADGGGSTTPPGHMIAILTQVLNEKHADLGMAAEAYCKLGMAVADAFVACWNAKYTWFLQRPDTYIKANIDPTWNPLIATPPFPTYASGHSTQSGAACQVLTDLFGIYAFTDHSKVASGFAPRSFHSFFEAAEEAAVSRLYGGIHFPMDNNNGFAAGKNIGKNITKIQFKKLAKEV